MMRCRKRYTRLTLPYQVWEKWVCHWSQRGRTCSRNTDFNILYGRSGGVLSRHYGIPARCSSSRHKWPEEVSQRLMPRNFFIWESKLFRRTIKGLSISIPISDGRQFLTSFHDNIGHSDLKTTRHFVTERYWWLTVCNGVSNYLKSCDGFQKAEGCPIPKYISTLHIPVSSLFDVFSVDFAWPFPVILSGNRFVLVAIKESDRMAHRHSHGRLQGSICSQSCPKRDNVLFWPS